MGKRVARSWQEHGKSMAMTWQHAHGDNMAGTWHSMAIVAWAWQNKKKTWQSHGKDMARAWQTCGTLMATAWQEHGKNMARAWQEHGKNMGTWHEQVQIPLSVTQAPPATEAPPSSRWPPRPRRRTRSTHGSAAAQGAASPPHAAPAAAQGASSPPHAALAAAQGAAEFATEAAAEAAEAVENVSPALYRRNGLLSAGILDRRGDRYVVSHVARNEAIDAVLWYRRRALLYNNLPPGAILPSRVRSLKSLQYPVIGCD